MTTFGLAGNSWEKLKVLLTILTNNQTLRLQIRKRSRYAGRYWQREALYQCTQVTYQQHTYIYIHTYICLRRCHYMLFQSKFFSSTELGRLPRVKTCANLMRLICYNNKDRCDTISHTYIPPYTYFTLFYTIISQHASWYDLRRMGSVWRWVTINIFLT